MSRYIEISMAKAVFDEGDKSLFDIAPSIDIVRCEECKWYEDPKHKIFENCVKWKKSHGIILPIKPNDSCSYGERSE